MKLIILSVFLLNCFYLQASELEKRHDDLTRSLTELKRQQQLVRQQLESYYPQDQVLMQEYQAQRVIYDRYYQQHLSGLVSLQELNYQTSLLNEKTSNIEAHREEWNALKAKREQLDNQITSTHNLIEEYATEIKLQGLTLLDTGAGNSYRSVMTSSSSVDVNENSCARLRQEQENFPQMSDPDYLVRMNRIRELRNCCSVSVMTDDLKVVGFTLSNSTQNDINTTGNGDYNSAKREWAFNFDNRSIQNINIEILDDSALTGKMSHDFLHTTLVFIPRKNLPRVARPNQNSCERDVYLPTGEIVKFNALTNEIVGGVLSELPIDLTASRHQRKFAGIDYNGRGIMIRVDRRAGTPEHIYGVAFNQNEDIKKATITHQGKTCKVGKEKLWDNAQNPDATPVFKFETDQEFLDVIINPICGWNLTMDDIS